MSQADLAIYLCHHGSSHQWFRAKWLGDLARLYCNGQVDWAEVLTRACLVGEERPVLLGLQLLGDYYGITFHRAPHSLAMSLPDSLARSAVRALRNRQEPVERTTWERIKENVRTYGYNRMLWPHGSWWGIAFVYSRLDFRVLSLPDEFFWLYAPLRPFLWLWRRRGSGLMRGLKKFREKLRETLSIVTPRDPESRRKAA
jgi:hypothetical protein